MGVKVTGKNEVKKMVEKTKDWDKKKIRTGFWEQGELEMIAGVHEFGMNIGVTDKMRGWFRGQGTSLKKTTTHIKIPERSFIRAGFDANIQEFTAFTDKTLHDALESGIPTKTVMNMLALMFKGQIQEFMRDLRSPPLSKFTIERTGRSNPLVHHGQLIGHIRSEME